MSCVSPRLFYFIPTAGQKYRLNVNNALFFPFKSPQARLLGHLIYFSSLKAEMQATANKFKYK